MSYDGQLVTIADYEHYARQVIPPALFDFFYGSHGDPQWSTETSNRFAFNALKFRPRVLIDVSTRNLATTFLGFDLSFPVVVGPTGAVGAHDPLGEVPTAKAAGAAGTIMVLSGVSTCSPRQIASVATGPWFQQVWMLENREVVEWQVRHAVDQGASAIVLTVSNSGDTWHTFPLRYPSALLEGLMGEATNLVDYDGPSIPSVMDITNWMTPSATWADVEWLRSLTSVPLIVKGIQTSEDAELAIKHGVDAIVVSNHGGRFLQGARGTIEALPEVIEAVAGRVEVCVDGGVRQGHDVLKALALGAKAVWIGRAARWGAAVAGEKGVAGVLEVLRRELHGAMGLCGITDVNEVPSTLLTRDAVATLEA